MKLIIYLLSVSILLTGITTGVYLSDEWSIDQAAERCYFTFVGAMWGYLILTRKGKNENKD